MAGGSSPTRAGESAIRLPGFRIPRGVPRCFAELARRGLPERNLEKWSGKSAGKSEIFPQFVGERAVLIQKDLEDIPPHLIYLREKIGKQGQKEVSVKESRMIFIFSIFIRLHGYFLGGFKSYFRTLSLR
jgi:hypothetical protein